MNYAYHLLDLLQLLDLLHLFRLLLFIPILGLADFIGTSTT